MAAPMNPIGYDAAALGNHEFNYGLELLHQDSSQMDADVLGADAVDPATKVARSSRPTRQAHEGARWPRSRVGMLGLTNPGWRSGTGGMSPARSRCRALSSRPRSWCRAIRLGCDVVIGAAHSGDSGHAVVRRCADLPENASSLLAEQVPGIDAILFGHAHLDGPQRLASPTPRRAGRSSCTRADYWGMRLSRLRPHLSSRGGTGRSPELGDHADTELQRGRRRPAVAAAVRASTTPWSPT